MECPFHSNLSRCKVSKSLLQNALLGPLTACAHTLTQGLVSQVRLQHSFMLHDTLTGLVDRINESPLASCAASLLHVGAVGHGTGRVSMLGLCPLEKGEHKTTSPKSAGLGSQRLQYQGSLGGGGFLHHPYLLSVDLYLFPDLPSVSLMGTKKNLLL